MPPASAGENSNHGYILRVYPRTKDIAATYNGCQVTFASVDDRWVVYLLIEVVDGDPFRMWTEEDGNSADAACRYRKGRVVGGDPKACGSIGLMKSMAPGCIKAISEWLAAEPRDASRQPTGCSWE